MKKLLLFLNLSLNLNLIVLSAPAFTQQVLDKFETLSGWKNIASDEVDIKTSIADGMMGKCIRIDFNFKAGTGYCGIEKVLPMKLPANYKFSFYIRGDAPVNNLEFKLIDKSGDNVWWLNQRSYEFPHEWKKETIKKRNIEFAWGPTNDKSLKEFDKLEIFVASVNGGKGTIYLDELSFQELEPLSTEKPRHEVILSSNSKENNFLLDNNGNTVWDTKKADRQEIIIDLKKHREYGGLVIDWDENNYAEKYNVLTSSDTKNWETAYEVKSGAGGRRYIDLKNSESRYIKLDLLKSHSSAYAIKDISVKDYEFSESKEKFFSEIARERPRGFYPRYLYNEQSFWTITGVNNDLKESLINSDGMIEVDKRGFSIEPFVFANNVLLNWNNTDKKQKLENDYLPIPSVLRTKDNLSLEIKTFSSGESGSSVLYIINKLTNQGSKKEKGSLYLTLRPFQVNPPWQSLNTPGGTSKVASIDYNGKYISVNNEKIVIPVAKPDRFGASEFDSGDITDYIVKDSLPSSEKVDDRTGSASAALKYSYNLNPGEQKEFILAVPFYGEKYDAALLNSTDGPSFVHSELKKIISFWENKLNTVNFHLPSQGKKLVNIIKSNLAYILINRDNQGIQPGSRSYERSWIRDGALTSSALLKMGITEEVKDFINWYSSFQYSSGKVPCVVDKRGPDPVPENDSHGELIFAIMQYYKFTKDTSFLRSRFSNVVNSVSYMNYLIEQRKTDYYKNGNDSLKTLYGLLPESISHEGYSAKPMHSYWDDFFALLGLKCAVEIAGILNENSYKEKFTALRDEFKMNLYNSINNSIKNHKINYIPGAAELGDFDATSTAIAIYPCGELKNLPEPYLKNTFDKYYENFERRLDPKFGWINYTPYEVRVIGTFVYLDQIERAHQMIRFFLSDQFPSAWNHWAEVVWKDTSEAKFIGDMPHTWVGSDFVSAVRAMFAYEDDYDRSLVIGAGLYDEWLDDPDGVIVKDLPTYYGKLNYSIKKDNEKLLINLTGNLTMPEGGIRIKNHKNYSQYTVKVNGKEQNDSMGNEIRVNEFPVEIEYVVKK